MSSEERDAIILIKVKSQDNEEIHFKIKRNTPLKKLMERYCERNGLMNIASVSFLYEGEKVLASSTPESLGMNDGDELAVAVNQKGGSN